MAKRFVQVSLGTKLRLLFGVAVVGVIAAALLVPWYFMELVSQQNLQRSAELLTELRLTEWLHKHPTDPKARSYVATIYALGRHGQGRQGPRMAPFGPDTDADASSDASARKARAALTGSPGQELVILPAEDEGGHDVYRCFRAVRVEAACDGCHGPTVPVSRQLQPGQFVGMIDASIPADPGGSGRLVRWTRYAFIGGGMLGGLFALIVFAIITQRLILRPLHGLRDIADRVTEGDWSVRSTIHTGDELERLGESFNEMLSAISRQHTQLRSVNRALDLKLHELAEANVGLYEANRVKSEFLANVSHELRTPLNSILGFAELIAESDDDRQRRYGQNVGIAARNLLNMINDILDLAKIEAGRADVRFDRVSITDTCRTLLALMGPLADNQQLDLRGELAPDLPIVTSDPGKVQQILYNLLSNAVKFTPPGGTVTLRATTSQTRRDGRSVPEVRVEVCDTGPGISEAEQQHIFEQFYQLDSPMTKKASGTGLGLAIARELTQLLGGQLTLESRPGHGATFALTLPVAPESDAAAPRPDAE